MQEAAIPVNFPVLDGDILFCTKSEVTFLARAFASGGVL